MNITIRNYKDEDFPAMEQLLKARGIPYEPSQKRDSLKRKLAYDPDSVMVAEAHTRLLGTVVLTYHPEQCSIHDLAIHPAYNGAGLEKRLLDEAIKRIKAKHLLWIAKMR